MELVFYLYYTLACTEFTKLIILIGLSRLKILRLPPYNIRKGKYQKPNLTNFSHCDIRIIPLSGETSVQPINKLNIDAEESLTVGLRRLDSGARRILWKHCYRENESSYARRKLRK